MTKQSTTLYTAGDGIESLRKNCKKLENHQTWEYNELPLRQKAIESKWVFKVKNHLDRSVAIFKARQVTQGFSQIPGIKFAKTFALTVRRKLLRIYLAICLFLNLIIHQVDIVGVYLEGDLSDNEFPIFMKLPPGMH